MFSWIGKRLSIANAAVVVAVVFAMSGGAYAASKIVISSIKQISPKVVKQLKGKNGTNGAPGLAGPAGPTGPQGAEGKEGKPGAEGKEGKPGAEGKEGKEGSPWTLGGTLPSGKTLTGEWGIWQHVSSAQTLGTTVSFGIPLKTAPAVHWIRMNEEEATATGEQKSTACKGSVANPTAEPGNLCLYTGQESGLSTNEAFNKFIVGWKWGMKVDNWPEGSGAANTEPNTASPFGFGINAFASEETYVTTAGTWAVTAE
jgi:hypothetical protein